MLGFDLMTTIAPFLSVRRSGQAVAFYLLAFGAKEIFRIENDRGEVVALTPLPYWEPNWHRTKWDGLSQFVRMVKRYRAASLQSSDLVIAVG